MLNIPTVEIRSNQNKIIDMKTNTFIATTVKVEIRVEGVSRGTGVEKKRKSIVSCKCFYATLGGKKVENPNRLCPSGLTQKRWYKETCTEVCEERTVKGNPRTLKPPRNTCVFVVY